MLQQVLLVSLLRDWLKNILQSPGVTVSKLSRWTHVNVGTIRRIVSGDIKEPGDPTIIALAWGVGINPDELLDFSSGFSVVMPLPDPAVLGRKPLPPPPSDAISSSGKSDDYKHPIHKSVLEGLRKKAVRIPMSLPQFIDQILEDASGETPKWNKQ